jgi:hypothetical protein
MNAAVARRQRFAHRWSPWIVVIGALLLSAGFAVWKESLPRAVVPAGGYVRYDDFAFTVWNAKEIGPGRYAVEVECQNRAKRVSFNFKPEMVDVLGLVATADSWKNPVSLDAGDSVRKTVILTGPAGMKSLIVWFRTGGDFGDFMDGLIGQNYEVQVPVK